VSPSKLRRGRAAAVVGATAAIVFSVFWILRSPASGPVSWGPDTGADDAPVPLDPASPWPKFRANALQNGRSAVLPRVDPERRPWSFHTGGGVFSSPVVDGEGTVYLGSADRSFYAIGADGRLRWSFETGGVIDSAALLDDRGRVYFGSGDAHVYALDRATGDLLWKFRADPVEDVEARYGVESYNVDWFEGNLAILADGTLIAPNDNFLIYALDRDTGSRRAEYLGNELMWSLPAVNARTGRMFAGSQFLALKNVFAFDTRTGETLWTAGGWGSNAASPLLTSSSSDGALVLGGFDGFVRAYRQSDGGQLWKRGVRDHVYASPAQLSDGTLVQPSTDGTVYALDPETGAVRWAFDTLGPIRASPAVDARDRIYVGNGEGRLFCLEPDGTLRWSYLLVEGERNDLNASPALGPDGIVVAGESGDVFLVPYDHPLSEAGRGDPRSRVGVGEDLPAEGALLVYTTPFGALRPTPPDVIDANQPLAFTLFVREEGDTLKTAIDGNALRVGVSGQPQMDVVVSADAQFVTLAPRETWTGAAGGAIRVELSGAYRRDPWRFGLKFFGGRRGGALEQRFEFRVRPRSEAPLPFRVPAGPGDPATRFEMSRFAAPNPTMLPSWNQIGFDSLRYLAGIVEGTPERSVVWVIAGRPDGERTVPDPAQALRFPLVLDVDGDLLTFRNDDGFAIKFVGAWDMPFGSYRISTRADAAGGVPAGPAALFAVANAGEIEYYGRFLKLMGLAELRSGRMPVLGGLDLAVVDDATAPEGVGSVRFERDATGVTATIESGRLRRADHVFSLLLVDAASGRPIPLPYAQRTDVESDAMGVVRSVRIGFDGSDVPDGVRALYLVDTSPAAVGSPTSDAHP